MLAGGSMMDQDEMSMIQAQTTSSGRGTIVIQKPLSHGVKLNIETDMGAADPNQCMNSITLTKDFQNSHVQYIYQGVHMVSYMQSISESLAAGYSMAFIVSLHAPSPYL